MTKAIKCSYAQLNCAPVSGLRLNLKYLNGAIFSLIILLGAFYLFNINDLTVKGFALKEMQTKAAALSNQRVDTEEKLGALESYYSLNDRVQKLNMVAVGDIEYLTSNQTALARR